MPKTLLLADDSVTIQKVVGISLANEDIKLVTVENGDDAVAKAEEIHPDIVLADIVMPGKNGYEVCETIKNDPKLGGTPVLLLTGTFEAFDAERARQVGADGHITKPFEAQALVDQVNQLLARSTPLGDSDGAAVAQETPAARPPAAAEGDAFDFFDGEETSAGEGWTRPSGPPGFAEETVLLDTRHGSSDPAFDAAVEAAAFDAPGERTSFQEHDDSGFDLDADLSMARTVPEVPVAPGSMSFSDGPSGPVERVPVSDPLLDFDPLADPRGADATVIDPTPVQSFDIEEPAAAPLQDVHDDADDFSRTVAIVEDVDPVRVQSPVDADTTAPEASPRAGAASGASALSPAVTEQLNAALERIAWEAFSDLSEQVVKLVIQRVEAVAWEVIPQMAETLIQEEIAKMQGGSSEED